jgi:hypothetical protein
MVAGRCHCGAISYELELPVPHHALCHCSDCRRHSGAPMVGWAMVPAGQLTVSGEVKVYASSEHGRRHFCSECGTGLFYVNEDMLPGLIDVQTGTLDDPDAMPPEANIQVAERVRWMEMAHELPVFERYPG